MACEEPRISISICVRKLQDIVHAEKSSPWVSGGAIYSFMRSTKYGKPTGKHNTQRAQKRLLCLPDVTPRLPPADIRAARQDAARIVGLERTARGGVDQTCSPTVYQEPPDEEVLVVGMFTFLRFDCRVRLSGGVAKSLCV